MDIDNFLNQLEELSGVEKSTMMGSPCLRWQGQFFAMWFAEQESLIVKVAAARVDQIIESGEGNEFNFTGKRFKEWVLIPEEFCSSYPSFLNEALVYAKTAGAK